MKNCFHFTMTALLLLGCAKLALGQYSGGNGTSGDPYHIATAENLIHLSLTSSHWDKHFIQTADIVFNSDHTLQDWNNSGSAGPAAGFSPIGNSTTRFTGVYNGQGYAIKGLFINRTSTDNVGLFGVIRNANISNIVLLDANITGRYAVGILIGRIQGIGDATRDNSSISNVFIHGNVSAQRQIGGFVGYIQDSEAAITDCHTNVDVTASNTTYSDAGGFAGSVGEHTKPVINRCSSSGKVTGNSRNVGGFIGFTRGITVRNSFSTADVFNNTTNQGNTGGFIGGLCSRYGGDAELVNCFATGNVSGGTNNSGTQWHNGIGGFIGTVRPEWSPNSKTIENCFSVGSVTQSGSSSDIGGFIGRLATEANFDGTTESANPTVTNCYWDTQRSTQASSAGGLATGLTTAQMKDQGNFTSWDFTNKWKMSSAITYDGYPSLEWAKGYSVAPASNQIADLSNLVWLAEDGSRWSGSYTQTADINTWWTCGWDYNKGWSPIGNSTTRFTGNYNGQNYKISNIFIDRPATDYIGFFGYTQKSTLNNIDLKNVNIAGNDRVGALAGMSGWWTGDNNHEITNCRVSGVVQGADLIGGLIGYTLGVNVFINTSYSNVKVSGNNEIGGLVGSFSNSKITDCYATGNISGNDGIGGLVGVQWGDNAAITRSYSIGSVEGSSNVGGLLGRRANGLLPANSFWDTQTSGQSKSAGGTGKTTAEMKTKSTFENAGWDFNAIWTIAECPDWSYPYLVNNTQDPAPGLETTTNPTDGGTIAAVQTICYGTVPAAFTSESLPTGHKGTLEYQWQKSTTGSSSGFSNISGATSAAFNETASLTQTTWYRRMARVDCMDNWDGAAATEPVTVTVRPQFTPGAIATTGQTICYNTAAGEIGSTTPASGGDGSITYSWRSSTDGFTNSTLIDGATLESYTPGTLTQTTAYRRYAKDGTCNTTPVESVGTWTITVQRLQQFRSIASGNWITASNWEQYTSVDNEWITATEYPCQNPNSCSDNPLVTIRAHHQLEIQSGSDSDITIPNLKIEANGKLTIKHGGKLIIQEKLQLDEQAGAAIVVE